MGMRYGYLLDSCGLEIALRYEWANESVHDFRHGWGRAEAPGIHR